MRAALFLLVGCGRLSFDASNLEEPAFEPCVGKWLEGDIMIAPQLLPNVNTSVSDLAPFLSSDGATLYFASARGGSTDDIFKATIATEFSDITPVPDLSSDAIDGAIAISTDGLFATVSSDRAGLAFGGRNLWQASRASTDLPFSDFTGEPFVNVNTAEGTEFEHWSSVDRLRLYVSSEAAGKQKITLSVRASTAVPFSAPIVIEEIDSPETQCCQSLTADERVIVFSSRRAGVIQLFYATRTSRLDPFTAPRAVPTIIPPSGFDLHTSLSGDGCTLYLSSTRPGVGGFDLWMSDV